MEKEMYSKDQQADWHRVRMPTVFLGAKKRKKKKRSDPKGEALDSLVSLHSHAQLWSQAVGCNWKKTRSWKQAATISFICTLPTRVDFRKMVENYVLPSKPL